MHPIKQPINSNYDPMHNRNRSFHDYSSFGLSIDVIDRRYERWKTTRSKALELKHTEHQKILTKIEKKNINREKSFAKFLRERNKKHKESLFKLSARRETAKIVHDNKIKYNLVIK